MIFPLKRWHKCVIFYRYLWCCWCLFTAWYISDDQTDGQVVLLLVRVLLWLSCRLLFPRQTNFWQWHWPWRLISSSISDKHSVLVQRQTYDMKENGSRQIGPRQIGPRQIGPLADLAAYWAPHFLGPNLPFFGKLGPGRLGPLAANWAPWKFCRSKLGPGKFWVRQIGPRKFCWW